MSPPPTSSSASGDGYRIVVVDDEPEIRDALAALVRARGRGALTVRAAAGGDEALALVDDWRPHAVLTDFRMPGMDGLTLLRTLREQHPNVARLLMTGYQELWEEKAQLDEADPILVVAKPWKNDELIATLFGALELP